MPVPRAYATITSGLRGYFAVFVVDDEPWQTGDGSYETAAEAEVEAISWARDEAVPYVAPKSCLATEE